MMPWWLVHTAIRSSWWYLCLYASVTSTAAKTVHANAKYSRHFDVRKDSFVRCEETECSVRLSRTKWPSRPRPEQP